MSIFSSCLLCCSPRFNFRPLLFLLFIYNKTQTYPLLQRSFMTSFLSILSLLLRIRTPFHLMLPVCTPETPPVNYPLTVLSLSSCLHDILSQKSIHFDSFQRSYASYCTSMYKSYNSIYICILHNDTWPIVLHSILINYENYQGLVVDVCIPPHSPLWVGLWVPWVAYQEMVSSSVAPILIFAYNPIAYNIKFQLSNY